MSEPQSAPTILRGDDAPACPICDGRARYRWTLRDRYWEQPGRWNLYVCTSCGHAFLAPIPEDLGRYYDHWYVGPGWERVRELQASAGNRFLHQLRLKRLSRYVDLTIRSEVLDVGCGQGIFLEEIRRAYGCGIAGCDTTDRGLVDMSPEPRRAIDFRAGEVGDVGFEDEHYDLVVALHVIEHVPDTQAFLRDCWAKVKPGGALAIETPNFGSAIRLLWGRWWPALEPPYHVHDFTERSLALALERAGLPAPAYIRTVPLFPEMTGAWSMAFKRLLVGDTWIHRLFRGLFTVAMVFSWLPFDVLISLTLTRVGLGGSVLAVVRRDADHGAASGDADRRAGGDAGGAGDAGGDG